MPLCAYPIVFECDNGYAGSATDYLIKQLLKILWYEKK